MRCLVTGGAGFIGSHLVARLLARGDEVRVLDNLRRGTREALAARSGAGALEFIKGDVRGASTLRAAADGCERIFHLAAQSNVIGALDDPDYSFTTNVGGTFNVLRCAVDLGVGRVVFTSSREVYGEALYVPVDEDHPLRAKNPYGASKLAGEAYCRTFAHCYGLDVAIVRLANVYGPGDRDRVIPLWLDRAAAGGALEVFGGDQVLDFVWIGTVVDALMLAGEQGLASPTNIGSGTGTPILELAQRVLDVTRSKAAVVRTAPRNAEVSRFVADVSRMRALGIAPDADPLAHLAELAALPATVTRA
ncbi:MAG: SDR family NAD(P)-dependent oxidoreductase [Chloroflexota bacterium]|nr:SDR family NAD(P)-dependent oxidoreductase [Chloroflexota bacterium]